MNLRTLPIVRSGEASRWRACYQRGLPRLFFLGTRSLTRSLQSIRIQVGWSERDTHKRTKDGHMENMVPNTRLTKKYKHSSHTYKLPHIPKKKKTKS